MFFLLVSSFIEVQALVTKLTDGAHSFYLTTAFDLRYQLVMSLLFFDHLYDSLCTDVDQISVSSDATFSFFCISSVSFSMCVGF